MFVNEKRALLHKDFVGGKYQKISCSFKTNSRTSLGKGGHSAQVLAKARNAISARPSFFAQIVQNRGCFGCQYLKATGEVREIKKDVWKCFFKTKPIILAWGAGGF